MPAPSWDAAAAAQMAGQKVQPIVFLRIAATPAPVRMWSGVGDYALPSDNVEPGGTIYKGLGQLLSLPRLQQLINGVAETVDFTLSGVDAQVVAMADAESSSVQNAAVNLGVAFLGEDLQPVSPTAWLWFGEVQTVKINRQASGDKIVRSIALTVGSAFVRRRRPALSYFTDADQQARSPGDTFCQRTPQYSMSVTKVWPVF